MKASFDVTLSPKDLYRFNMYQTYTGFQGWSSIALGILGFVMAGISFQNGKTSYTLLYAAVGFLFLLYIPVTLWFRAKETLKTNKVLAGTLHYEITEKNIHVSQGKETGDMEWQAIYKIVANAKTDFNLQQSEKRIYYSYGADGGSVCSVPDTCRTETGKI